MNESLRKNLTMFLLTSIFLSTILFFIFYSPPDNPDTESKLYYEETFEFDNGGYPRMSQIDDELIIIYHDSRIVTINLTDSSKGGPYTNIIPNGGRSTLFYDDFSENLICVFNHGGSGAGDSIGIAIVGKDDYKNPAKWNITYNLLGPVQRPFEQVGIWEPYLIDFNKSDGKFLLMFSNQTEYDLENLVDDEGYYHEEGGNKMVQVIDVKWIKWNGTDFNVSDAGIISDGINGEKIHYKDGMVSAVDLGFKDGLENGTHEYITAFEAFKPGDPSSIHAVKIAVSEKDGVTSEWRRVATSDHGTAPFMTTYNNTYTISYRHRATIEDEVLGFVGMNQDDYRSSNVVHAESSASIWPSIFTSTDGRLWTAGQDLISEKLVVQNLIIDFGWRDESIPSYIIFPLLAIAFLSISIILMKIRNIIDIKKK